MDISGKVQEVTDQELTVSLGLNSFDYTIPDHQYVHTRPLVTGQRMFRRIDNGFVFIEAGVE